MGLKHPAVMTQANKQALADAIFKVFDAEGVKRPHYMFFSWGDASVSAGEIPLSENDIVQVANELLEDVRKRNQA